MEETNQIFEEEISKIYSELLKNQEPLGKELDKVLFENIEDLYEN